MSSPELDWDALRTKSLQPHGFGEDRASIWTSLLDAHSDSELTDDGCPPHPDERQVSLDTARSFVVYPSDPSPDLQATLLTLLVTVFRRNPTWGYFQGLHDTVSVMMLTLEKERRVECVEKMCCQRVKDAMGSGLEPIVGHLRSEIIFRTACVHIIYQANNSVLRNLMRVADPEYAAILES